MRRKKLMVALSIAGLVTLAACGGSGSPTNKSSGNESITGGPGAGAGQGKDPTRQAPAADVEGAQTGGTLDVIASGGITTLDPTEAYYLDTGSILSGLVTRSLTQFV